MKKLFLIVICLMLACGKNVHAMDRSDGSKSPRSDGSKSPRVIISRAKSHSGKNQSTAAASSATTSRTIIRSQSENPIKSLSPVASPREVSGNAQPSSPRKEPQEELKRNTALEEAEIAWWQLILVECKDKLMEARRNCSAVTSKEITSKLAPLGHHSINEYLNAQFRKKEKKLKEMIPMMTTDISDDKKKDLSLSILLLELDLKQLEQAMLVNQIVPHFI